MMLADKILLLRKQNGWSQEELAEKVNVSRQSISKWESAQSIPDLDKVLVLAQIFDVTTDFLLTDNEANETKTPADVYIPDDSRKISMEEANAFIKDSKKYGLREAIGAVLCTSCPIPLIFMAGLSSINKLSENFAGIGGTVILLFIIAIAVSIFIFSGQAMEKYGFIENENHTPLYDVEGLCDKLMEQNKTKHTVCMIVGVLLCILCAVPLIVVAGFNEENEFLLICMVCVLLAMVSVAVFLFMNGSIINDACDKLLERGDYTRAMKATKKKRERITSTLWSITVAIYLGISFITNDWGKTWVVWPVAALIITGIKNYANSVILEKYEEK